MRNISNSEVNTWLHCRRRYYYEYILDLEPKAFSDPLANGILVHSILESYYIAKQDELSEEDCREAAMTPLKYAANASGANLENIVKMRNLALAYFEKYAEEDERFEVMAVETEFSVPIIEGENGFALAGTIDVVFSDRETGDIIPVDHKSSYNFWTDDQASITGQFVKYVYALRAKGFNVDRFMINQLRTREVKNGDLFRRMYVRPTEPRIRSVVAQHVNAGAEIMEFRKDPVKERTIPIYDKFGCSSCSFFQVCNSDAEGTSTDVLLATEFQTKQHYGYNKEKVNE